MNVGDKVIILEEGRIGEIVAIGGNRCNVKIDGVIHNYDKDYVALIDDTEITRGDTVVLTSDYDGISGGSICVVSVVEDNDQFRIDTAAESAHVAKSDIVKIKPARFFKVGDTVEVRGTTGTIKEADYTDFIAMYRISTGGVWHGYSEVILGLPAIPELKTGMLCKIRNGRWYVVIEEKIYNLYDGCFLPLSNYDNNLKDDDGDSEFDIIAVATVDYLGDIFRLYGKSNKEIEKGIDIIWDRQRNVKRIAELKEIIANAQKELDSLE